MNVQTPETPRRFSLRLDVYVPPQVLQTNRCICHPPLPPVLLEPLQTAGPLCSTGITRLHRYCGPIRHPLAFGPFPGVAGYKAYLPPAISRRGEEGFSSCLACPCHRAAAFTPPKWCSRINQISAAHAAFAHRTGAQPSDKEFRGHIRVHLRYGPVTR